MPRFVRIYNMSHVDVGARLRIDYEHGVGVIADENVLPDCIDKIDANHVKTLANISLDARSARWLRDTLSELLVQLDEEKP